MRKYICFIVLTCIFSLTTRAQHPNIKISSSNSPEEPTICVNPFNTDIIVAGANINNYYYSDDAGYTWNTGQLTSTYGVWGDPCIVVDKYGDFYFFHLSNPGALGNWIDRIVCQKTTDGGVTWNSGTYMGLNGEKEQDKEWVAVDFTNNNIYSTWTQFDKYGSANSLHKSNILFAKSTDDGATWTNPVQINELSGDCIDEDNTTEGAVPAIGPNGEIFVAWAFNEKIYFDKSIDEGTTWLDNDIYVADQPGGWDYSIPGIKRCNGLPITSCDTSPSAFQGNIYVNWADQRNGTDDTDVWIAKSTDSGETWSLPKRVNDDAPGKQQFLTWMTIDQSNGKIYIVFYDRRSWVDNTTDVYVAMSEDGGDTFTNFKISESPFVPNENVFFGDYTNISAYNDLVRPMWTRLDGSSLSVWTAIVNPDSVEVSLENNITWAENETYPNPTQGISYFSYKLKEKATVRLSLYDIYGHLVKQFVNNQEQAAGKYIEQVDMKNEGIAPGIYFYSFACDNKQITRKVIFVE